MKREAPKNVRRAVAPPPRPAPEAEPSPRAVSTSDVSPAPPSVKSVRPPPPPKPKGPSRLRAGLVKTWSLARVVLGVALVAGASVGAAWGAKTYVTKSPRFVIKTVTVEGASRLTPDGVARAGGVAVGQNVFALDLESARAKIEHEPYVAHATVTRKLPSTVAIQITEREPALLVSIGESLYLATREGEIFKELADGDPTDLPLVTGIAPDMVARDREGATLLVRRALDVADELGKTNITKRYPLQEIHLDKDGTVEAVVGREAISLVLGTAPFKGKLEEADRVLAELAKRKSNAAVVFLDGSANPDRVVVRMR
jgi:cell division protein FtsQ